MDINTLPQVAIKLLMALALGSLIGWERENKARPAGLRTHVLVCLGATIVQMTSVNFYAAMDATGDPFRLGAQVISGIGFLGAGTILKTGPNIKGLTTAASLWATACIGLTIGVGLYIEAAASILVVIAALKGLSHVELMMESRKKNTALTVVADNTSYDIGEVFNALSELDLHVTHVNVIPESGEFTKYKFTFKSVGVTSSADILSLLSNRTGVRSISMDAA